MDAARSGPIDLVLLRFAGNEFNGGIAPALRQVVDRGIVRVVDILFVYKDADGKVGSLEVGALGPQLDQAFIDVDGQLGGGLLDAEDVDEVGKDLDLGSSIAVVAIENVWTIPFVAAVREAGGELVDQARVPSQVVDEIRSGVG
jgi:hypothetical protein